MPAPTKLVVTFTQTANVAAVTISIPSSLQSLDSGQLASTQTGFSASDIAIRNIFKAGTFTDGNGNWYDANQIASITAA